MEVPSILKGESLTRLCQGAAVGAIATIIIGFSWGGWISSVATLPAGESRSYRRGRRSAPAADSGRLRCLL
jgi:hypothetical protein